MNRRRTRVMLGLVALLTVGCAGPETMGDRFLTGEVERLGEESQSGRLHLRGMLNPADGSPYQVYELELGANEVIRLVAESGEFEPRLALYNEDGELLGVTQQGGEYDSRNRQQLIRRVAQAGTYLVVVSSVSNRDFGSFEINAETVEESGEFTFPGEAEGYLYVGQGVHPVTGAPYQSYPLEIDESTLVEVEMQSSDFDPYLSVVNEGSETILAERYGDGDRAFLIMELEAGSYEIRVSTGRVGVDGKFRLNAQVAEIQRSETFELGEVYRGFLAQNRETIPGMERSGEALHFELEEEAVLTATMMAEDFDGYMVLTDASGMVITEDDDSAGQLNPRITWPLEAGSYILWATSFSEEESGIYRVETSLSDENPFEATIEGPIELGESVEAQLTQADGRYRQRNTLIKYYSLEITEETEVKIELRSSSFDTYLVLEDEGGRLITENDDGVMGTTDSEIIYRLEPGTYRIGVTSFAEGQFGAFELMVDQAVSGQRV